MNWNNWILQKNAEFTLGKLGMSREEYTQTIAVLSKNKNPVHNVTGTPLSVKLSNRSHDIGVQYDVYHGSKKVGHVRYAEGEPYGGSIDANHSHHLKAVENHLHSGIQNGNISTEKQ